MPIQPDKQYLLDGSTVEKICIHWNKKREVIQEFLGDKAGLVAAQEKLEFSILELNEDSNNGTTEIVASINEAQAVIQKAIANLSGIESDDFYDLLEIFEGKRSLD
jgi:hypothetical protein